MIQKVSIVAYQVAEIIDLKKFRSEYTGTLHSSSSTELFYFLGDNSYLYLFNYGCVALANMDQVNSGNIISLIKKYSTRPLGEKYREDFTIESGNEISSNNQRLNVPEITSEIIKVAMLNVAQSTTLDFYTEQSHQLLAETSKITTQLEKNGALKISRKNLLKFIGKTLNLNNRIIDNLYVLDEPESLWEKEHLSQVNAELMKVFDTKMRFREIEYTVKIVSNNLSIFTDLNLHNESKWLEVTIIVLILIEIINMVIEKLL